MTQDRLSANQLLAIEHVRQRAQRQSPEAMDSMTESLENQEIKPEELMAILKARARVTLNFHPDRLTVDGASVVESFLKTGSYQNQWQTGISNGGLTAHRGGDRERWERQMFGDAYDTAEIAERPRYGALNLMSYLDGASPRFGSCHIELADDMVKTVTLSHGDSVTNPEHVGTIDEFAPILAPLLREASSGSVLGSGDLDRAGFLARLTSGPERRWVGRSLDSYVEAQVHSPIDFGTDVARIVMDPSFHSSTTGQLLQKLASRHAIPIETHPGFQLTPEEVPDDFRGPRVPLIAKIIADRFSNNDLLNALVVGQAAVSVAKDPSGWVNWATPAETLQHMKQLWHCLVQFGRPD